MRILTLIDVFSFRPTSGAGTYLFENAKRLSARGHDVTVLCRRRDDLPEDGAVDGVRFVTFAGTVRNPLAALPCIRRAFRAGAARLRTERDYDLVHTHHPLPLNAAFGALDGLPVVYTYQSPWAEEYRQQTGRATVGWSLRRRIGYALRDREERRALARAAHVLVLSDFMGGRAAMRGAPSDRIRILPGGTDPDRFRPGDRAAARERLGLPRDRFLVATVRRLVPRMGVGDLIDAVGLLRAEIPDLFLAVGGTGPMADPLAARARAAGLDDRVRFLGFVPDEDLPDLYRAADIVVVPTRELEGFGLVAVEGMACGIPVLATPAGSLPEVVGPFEPALLTLSTGPEALAERLRHWSSRRAELPAIGARARDYVLEHYTWDRSVDALEGIFREVVGR